MTLEEGLTHEQIERLLTIFLRYEDDPENIARLWEDILCKFIANEDKEEED